jgi:hypothetical protein
MAVANGYGKVVTSGSAFMYDTGDTFNSYKGKPGYNVTGTPVAWVGNNNTSDFKTTTGTATVNIPAIGTREVYYVDIWNTGASNCCPSLWRYGDWGITTGVTGNTLYTYSIIYKTNSGYTNPNFMYRYEFNGGSYITEVGVFDNAKRIDLGDGWYQAYNTFTTNASTNTLYLGMWYYQYNVYDTVYLYKASLTQGNHVFPPEQFIPPSTTRSTTQGLLPIVGDSTLNLSNMSYNSNAQMTFDGTDDKFNTGIGNLGNNATYEAIIYCKGNVSTYNMFMGQLLPYIGVYNGNSIIYSDSINSTQRYPITSGGTISYNKYHHVICTREYDGSNTTMKIYIDNILQSQTNWSGAATYNNDTVNIGDGQSSTWYPFYGDIPIAKTYNRALTPSEVTQNYNKYKTRFNLP